MSEMTVGEALVALLEQAGVAHVFGIPGVHTVEMYRGLDRSHIAHITPRHEQGAAFMADGYARMTGRPGVCLLITGPGLVNAATGVAQARAESSPMLVISSVNKRDSLDKHRGHLHELPDQGAFAKTVFKESFRVMEPSQLNRIFAAAWDLTTKARPGPVHIEIPTDVLGKSAPKPVLNLPDHTLPEMDLVKAAQLCDAAKRPVMVLGGGSKTTQNPGVFQDLALKLDAPAISTTNARGIMAGSPLDLPVSPSLKPVRDLMADADLLIVLGSEIGPTDFDMYQTGEMPPHSNMIRVDISPEQLGKRSDLGLAITGNAEAFAKALTAMISCKAANGEARTKATLQEAKAELPADYKDHIEAIESIWKALPEAVIVGDSTQSVYAGNLILNVPAPRAWFNTATGFGTLGFAASAALGAFVADPEAPVICLTGDGGLQFSLGELGTARDMNANVAYVVWNNEGYREIETSMRAAGVSPVGVTPSAPDFVKVAEAYGLPARKITDLKDLNDVLLSLPRPCLIEYYCP